MNHVMNQLPQQHTVTGTFDPFKRTQQQAPITTRNKYSALESKNDSDDIDEDVPCTNHNGQEKKEKLYNPNRRQRQRLRLFRQQHTIITIDHNDDSDRCTTRPAREVDNSDGYDSDDFEIEERIRDVVAIHKTSKDEWTGLRNIASAQNSVAPWRKQRNTNRRPENLQYEICIHNDTHNTILAQG